MIGRIRAWLRSRRRTRVERETRAIYAAAAELAER